MTKIYITGFNGYLGSAICRKIPEKNLIKIGNPEKKYRNINVIKDLPNKVEKDSVCLHLASISGEESEQNKKKTLKVNVEYTDRICDLNFKKIIFFSTSSVYGLSNRTSTETDNLNPTNYYTETKILAEEIVIKSEKNIILRMSNLMGEAPKMNWSLFVNYLIKCIKQSKKIEIYNPNQFRPFLNVSDAVDALSQILNDTQIKGIFNFGLSDMNFKKIDIINSLKEFYSKLDYTINDENEKIYPSKPRDYKIDCSKIKKYFRKKTSLQQTFKELSQIKTF